MVDPVEILPFNVTVTRVSKGTQNISQQEVYNSRYLDRGYRCNDYWDITL